MIGTDQVFLSENRALLVLFDFFPVLRLKKKKFGWKDWPKIILYFLQLNFIFLAITHLLAKHNCAKEPGTTWLNHQVVWKSLAYWQNQIQKNEKHSFFKKNLSIWGKLFWLLEKPDSVSPLADVFLTDRNTRWAPVVVALLKRIGWARWQHPITFLQLSDVDCQEQYLPHCCCNWTNCWDLEAFFSGKRLTNPPKCSCVGENML